MFDMMSRVDKFIFYDDAQYSKQGWQTRNRIKSYNGVTWLTININKKYKLGTPVSEIRVSHQTGWRVHNLDQIKEAYRKAEYFNEYYPLITNFLKDKHEKLMDYSVGSIKLVADILGIDVEIEFSSKYNISSSRGPQKVVDICLAAGGNEYFDGSSGQEMYDRAFFLNRGIAIHFHDYEHPKYRQLHGEFVSHMSVLDLLLNEGPNSLEILRSGGKNNF